MALINSIAIFHGKGKIGNVYLSRSRSRQRIKSLPVSKAIEKNEVMKLNQNKALPAFRLWGYCNAGLFGLHALRTSSINRYNVFCKMVWHKLPAVTDLSNSQLFDNLAGLNFGSNKAIRVNSISLATSSITVNYYIFPQMLPKFVYMMILINDSGRGGYKLIDHKFTSEEKSLSEITLPFEFINPSSGMVYIYTKDRKFTSNIMVVDSE